MTGRTTWRHTARGAAAALGLLLLAGCGGGGEAGGDGGRDEAAAAAQLPGIPVDRPTGDVDEQLAEKGEELFRTRGCVSCHTVGEGRRVGPDLEGVTGRRTFEWTYHMVMNPDSMVKNDSIAKRLLGEYFTPMSNQNVQPEQFRAIYEYLRSESGDDEGEG
jgi:mono/diheme cytochrome c family protein